MLQTTISNIHLKNCLYNASGAKCTSQEELLQLTNCSHVGAVLSKSCTLEKRNGNPFPRYYQTDYSSINSTGLANEGYKFYKEMTSEIKKLDVPYIISVAGLSREDNIKILKDLHENNNIDLVELNLSCPNIPGKPQLAYDFSVTEALLDDVFEFWNKPLGIKLPPYFDHVHFQEMAEVIKKFPKISFITCINSLGNGLILDPEKESVVIKPKNGLGGIGGSIIKPIALSNVHMFYKLLGDGIDIIGCGGVSNGIDVFEHILCGAKAVQIGTQLMREGIGCFERISKEFEDYMKGKGYKNIEEFRGKLKYL